MDLEDIWYHNLPSHMFHVSNSKRINQKIKWTSGKLKGLNVLIPLPKILPKFSVQANSF